MAHSTHKVGDTKSLKSFSIMYLLTVVSFGIAATVTRQERNCGGVYTPNISTISWLCQSIE